jgi:hypothetical protein
LGEELFIFFFVEVWLDIEVEIMLGWVVLDFEFEFILYSFQFGDSSGRDVVFVVIGIDFRYG